MIKQVAAKYQLSGISPGKHQISGIGIVDLSTMTLAEADALYRLKVPFLVKVKREPRKSKRATQPPTI